MSGRTAWAVCEHVLEQLLSEFAGLVQSPRHAVVADGLWAPLAAPPTRRGRQLQGPAIKTISNPVMGSGCVLNVFTEALSDFLHLFTRFDPNPGLLSRVSRYHSGGSLRRKDFSASESVPAQPRMGSSWTAVRHARLPLGAVFRNRGTRGPG
jgi:hypothetical protein